MEVTLEYRSLKAVLSVEKKTFTVDDKTYVSAEIRVKDSDVPSFLRLGGVIIYPATEERIKQEIERYRETFIEYAERYLEELEREEKRRKALEWLKTTVWSRPLGILPGDPIPSFVYEGADRYTIESYTNKLVPVITSKWYPTTPEGEFIVYRFTSFRHKSKVFLIHSSLDEKPLHNVKIKINESKTVYIVLPGGDWTILHITGSYQSRGKWAPEYKGFYIDEIYVKESDNIKILYWHKGLSHGGGLGAKTLVLAVRNLEKPILIARIKVTETPEQVGYRYLYSNGQTLQYLPEELEDAEEL